MFHDGAALLQSCRLVHERPFQELPEDVSKGEAYEVARDALLQLNIMLRRGIEPDALMYTSLIATMGRAGLEWQSYKLFSRMIEQQIRPLPETYVALRDATAKHRLQLRGQIQAKIEESMDVFPEALAADEVQRRRAEDQRCVAKFKEYMRGELPPPPPSSSSSLPPDLPRTPSPLDGKDRATAAEEAAGKASSIPPTPGTMHIRHPTDVWRTMEMADEQRRRSGEKATGESATELRRGLEQLDVEELQIYLAAQRQLRHGDKDELIHRILSSVGEGAIRAMLARRHHYFRSVEQILAADLRQLHALGASAVPPPGDGGRPAVGAGGDRTLTTAEREAAEPEVLQTPWGILRKPMQSRPTPPTPRNAARLERIQLTAPELLLLRQKAERNDLDEVPESLLRRYAYQFQLRWRRKSGLTSLLDAVQWHVSTYFSSALLATDGELPPPTPALRLQKEKEGMRETLENFEAFRVIAQRTNNLQVVDSKEINHHLHRVRRDARRQERLAEKSQRREQHLMEATGLAAAAKSFVPPVEEHRKAMQVLGFSASTEGNLAGLREVREEPANDTTDTAPLGSMASTDITLLPHGDRDAEVDDTGDAELAPTGELPPWAIGTEEEEFNLTTGRFGDPRVGRYQELSDSSIRVLPSQAAQKKWSVDRRLLPTALRDVVQAAEMEAQRRHEEVEREYEHRSQYKKYQRWDRLLSSAQEKKEARRRELLRGEVVQPLPSKRRMSQLLRAGCDKQRVSEELLQKYNRSL